MQDPAFSLTNPNKARALIRASQEAVRFAAGR